MAILSRRGLHWNNMGNLCWIIFVIVICCHQFTSAQNEDTTTNSQTMSSLKTDGFTATTTAHPMDSVINTNPLTSTPNLQQKSLQSTSTQHPSVTGAAQLNNEVTVDDVTVTTVEPQVNISAVYQQYWVKIVLQVSPAVVDIESEEFRSPLEEGLAKLYDEALRRQELKERGEWMSYGRRRKRQATAGAATIQITETTRPDIEKFTEAHIAYVMVENYETGDETKYTDPSTLVYLMGFYEDMELAISLGYPVITKIEIYDPPVAPKQPQYWIIGAVLGGLVGLGIIIWCVLFMYFKCVRPPSWRKRGQGSYKSPRVGEGGESEAAKKYPQGFDYARTQMGMENETKSAYKPQTQIRHQAQPGKVEFPFVSDNGGSARQIQDRSFGRGYPPGAKGPNAEAPAVGRGSRPPSQRATPVPGKAPPSGRNTPASAKAAEEDAVQKTELDPLYAKPKKKKAMSRATTVDSDAEHKSVKSKSRPASQAPSRASSRPPSRAKVKKGQSEDLASRAQSRSQSRASDFENIPQMSRVVDEVPVHSSVHQGALPPIKTPQMSLDNGHLDQEELRNSLKQKSDIEHARNKERHRERKLKKQKCIKQGTEDTNSVIDPDLPGVFVAQPKKKKTKKKKEKRQPKDQDTLEMRPIYDPNSPESTLRSIEPTAVTPIHQLDLGELLSDSDEEEREKQKAIDEAREKMHQLLDEAFNLVSPRFSKEEIEKRQQALLEQGPRHTPMYITPVTNGTPPHAGYNPYLASDAASRIDPNPKQVRSRAKEAGPLFYKRPTTVGSHHETAPPATISAQYSNPAFIYEPSDPLHLGALPSTNIVPNQDYIIPETRPIRIVEPTPPIRTAAEIKKALQPDDYTSITMDARSIYGNPEEDAVKRVTLPEATPDATSSPRAFKPIRNPGNISPIYSIEPNSLGASHPGETESLGATVHEYANNLNGQSDLNNSYLAQSTLGLEVDSYFNGNKPANQNGDNNKTSNQNGDYKATYDGDDDEIDVAERVTKPGRPLSSQPLVNSIREELQRLAEQSNAQKPLKGFKG